MFVLIDLIDCRIDADVQVHGTTKLVPYFTVMNYCLVSRTEKLMVSDNIIKYFLIYLVKLIVCIGSHRVLCHCHKSDSTTHMHGVFITEKAL